ncbi:MAG: hypothetical protein AAFZ49_00605, partial [Cyanobacteria bacterium J06659_2]
MKTSQVGILAAEQHLLFGVTSYWLCFSRGKILVGSEPLEQTVPFMVEYGTVGSEGTRFYLA